MPKSPRSNLFIFAKRVTNGTIVPLSHFFNFVTYPRIVLRKLTTFRMNFAQLSSFTIGSGVLPSSPQVEVRSVHAQRIWPVLTYASFLCSVLLAHFVTRHLDMGQKNYRGRKEKMDEDAATLSVSTRDFAAWGNSLEKGCRPLSS